MKCKLCKRDAQENGFCQLHSKAYTNVQEKFRVWEAALNVSWSQYLVEVQKNSLTGVWAKEVVKHLIEEGTEVDK
jgi:hypothetical protein